jgi:hypothetical protein
MQLTLSISGSRPEIEALLRQLDGFEVQLAEPEATVELATRPSDMSLITFCSLLSARGIAAAEHLVATSGGVPQTADELATALSLTRGELYGVLGGLGKAWAKAVPGFDNPFGSKWSEAKRDAAWSLSREFAERLQTALARHQRRQAR